MFKIQKHFLLSSIIKYSINTDIRESDSDN